MSNEKYDSKSNLEFAIYSFNNVKQYFKDAIILIENNSISHTLALNLIGIEEFINGIAFYLQALGIDFMGKQKKQRGKSPLIHYIHYLEEALNIAFIFWIQARREAFEILINYIQAEPGQDEMSQLSALMSLLKHDDSVEAKAFNSLYKIYNKNQFTPSHLEKLKFQSLFVSKIGNPLLLTPSDLKVIHPVLNSITQFIDSILKILKMNFINSDLFEKHQQIANNIREHWPEIKKSLSEYLI